MTDTDAGKMSDAELAGIIARNNTEKNYRAAINERIYGADADVAKLLSHIAALTTNRGSVSEERAREILADKCKQHSKALIPFAKMLRDPHYIHAVGGIDGQDALRFTQLPTILVCAIAAIQQAVSECSGGGAEEMRAAIKARLGKCDCAVCVDVRKICDSALPLPPSPVLLDELRWAPDRIVTNHENERVWLKKIEGGITDCCLASEPCKFHGSLTHQASKGKQ